MARHHLCVDLTFERIFNVALRNEIGERVLNFRNNLAVLRFGGWLLDRRIFEYQTLKREQTVGDRLRAHLFERAELAGAHHDFLSPERARQNLEQRGNLAAQAFVTAVLAAESAYVRVFTRGGH